MHYLRLLPPNEAWRCKQGASACFQKRLQLGDPCRHAAFSHQLFACCQTALKTWSRSELRQFVLPVNTLSSWAVHPYSCVDTWLRRRRVCREMSGRCVAGNQQMPWEMMLPCWCVSEAGCWLSSSLVWHGSSVCPVVLHSESHLTFKA